MMRRKNDGGTNMGGTVSGVHGIENTGAVLRKRLPIEQWAFLGVVPFFLFGVWRGGHKDSNSFNSSFACYWPSVTSS